MIQITVNGKPDRVDTNATVASLLDSLDLKGKRIAVEKNSEIVPKSQYADVGFDNGDVVEIVVAVGGG